MGYEVDAPSHNTRSHTRQRSSNTQEATLAYVNRSQLTVTPANLEERKFPKEILSAVLDEDTGELTEYRKLMKNTKYHPLYQNSNAKEIRRLVQGIPGLV